LKIQNTRAGEPAIPPDPPKALKETARAWEVFVGSGEFIGTPPRPVIAQSWQRCRDLGINPFMERAPTVLGPDEIEAILGGEDFGRAGKQVLDTFAQVVAGTGHVIVLADAQGRLVYSVGHRGVERMLERINFMPGAAWSETAAGSNGEGTPIALGRPEVVFGTEHYCRQWQPWVCYGCPVRGPAIGRVLGGVDISGPAKKVQTHTFALTVSIARSIEQLLSVFELQRRETLLTLSRGLERKWAREGILVVTESGRVADMNHAAARALGVQPSALRDAPLAELVPALWTPVQQSVESRSPREEGVMVRTPSGAEKTVLCRVEPVIREGRTLGSVVIFSDRPAASTGQRRVTVHGNPGPASTKYTFGDILGESPALRKALHLARAAARGSQLNPILIVGESGTGKELVAHAIHAESPRAQGPFVVVHCGALPRELVESELFGYAPGAFTGARREGQAGKFTAAHEGTIFLDEVDTMPMELQGKFLRVLEAGEVVRLGSATPVPIDVRIVAACSVDLRQRVEDGTFRLDLFYRLSAIEIFLPPLRERGDDIQILAAAFLERECAEAGKGPLAISPEAADRLRLYSWPGNIRELRNLCAHWTLTVEGPAVHLEHAPRHIREPIPDVDTDVGPGEGLRRVQETIIRRTLEETGGDVGEAARRLGVAKTTIYRRLKRARSP